MASNNLQKSSQYGKIRNTCIWPKLSARRRMERELMGKEIAPLSGSDAAVLCDLKLGLGAFGP
jgi:hypothetical protein